jgi:hypothetical protein
VVHPELAQIARLFPVVVGGRAVVLIVVEGFLVFALLVMSLSLGDAPSSVIAVTVVLPPMLLVTVCCPDLVANLRRTGELELAVTLASPARVVLRRMVPVVLVAAVQTVVVAAVLTAFLAPWQVFVGVLHSVVPLACVTATVLYWNLRLGTTGAVLTASLLSLAAIMWWLSGAEMFPEPANAEIMTPLEVVLSALRCQLGLMLATVVVAALAWRRLDRAEELLDA